MANESITVEFRGLSDLVGAILETLTEGAWTYDWARNDLALNVDANEPYSGRNVVGHVTLFWDGEQERVDRQVILRGLARVYDPDVQLNSALRASIQRAVSTDAPNGTGCLDIEEADVVAQLGLFGEIVYG